MTNGLTVDVTISDAAWTAQLPEAAAMAREASRAAWRAVAPAGADGAELSLLLADDAAVRDLNRAHRGQDRPTNVLSFSLGTPSSPDGVPTLLGDVVLASGVVSREAKDQGKPLAAHFRHLVVHGVLHLAGFDHETRPDADAMEALEVEILAGLGVSDPYRDQAVVS
ncbi:MAG: rRNA maturation RNase YbeY [Pseudomonadota bacterium]